MAAFRGEGNTVAYTNTGTAISSGTVVPLTDCCGVPIADIAATSGTGVLALSGEYNVPCADDEAFTQGQKVYWDATTGEVTSTSSGNTPVGYIMAAVGTSTATANVRLHPF